MGQADSLHIRHMPRVAVIVLNWKRPVDSMRCLESLQALTYPAECRHIIYVDNASRDGSVQRVAQSFPDVTVIENAANLGYAGGNNVGLRRACADGAEYVLVLNNDTVVDPQLLDNLVAFAASHPRLGAATPKILESAEPTRIWSAGCTFNERSCEPTQRGHGQFDNGIFALPGLSDYAVGCGLFMTSEAIARVGLFDEEFYLVFEDADWSFRARNAGFEIWYVASAQMWHQGSASFGTDAASSALYRYYWTRNSLLFCRRHLLWPNRWVTYCTLLIRWCRYIANWWRSDHPASRLL